MGGLIVGRDWCEKVIVELVKMYKQFCQITVQILIDLLERLTEFGGDVWC